MSRLHRFHISFTNSYHKVYHHDEFSIHPNPHGKMLFRQPRGFFHRPKMVKSDTQAGVQGHSISELPGRHFLIPPWLPLVVWSVIFIFILVTIAGFILAFQARREFRVRVEEQRKLLEIQSSGHQPKLSISSKELKSFTRKSIMVLNSASQSHVSPYRISVAGHIAPRNVFDRPSRNSVLVAQIVTPQVGRFSEDDSFYQFARTATRASTWDTTSRKSIVSMASVSSMMTKLQQRKVVGFAMLEEQLDDEVLGNIDQPSKRFHRAPQSSNLRVKDHLASGIRFVPTTPTRLSQSVSFANAMDLTTPTIGHASSSVPSDGINQVKTSPSPELSSPSPISADEALAQYASSRSTTPIPPAALPSRSNSLLKFVRRSLTSPLSPSTTSQASDLSTPKNNAEMTPMHTMNLQPGDYSRALNDSSKKNFNFDLHPFSLKNSVIFEDEEAYLASRKLNNSAMLLNSVVLKNESNDVSPPSRLPPAVLKESGMVPSSSSSSIVRPKLIVSPASFSSLSYTSEPDSSNSTCPSPIQHTHNNLPTSPRDGFHRPIIPNLTPPNSVTSHTAPKINASYPSESSSPPSLTSNGPSSLSSNPYSPRLNQDRSKLSSNDRMGMVGLMNQREHLKRNISNPNQSYSNAKSSRTADASLRPAVVRRAASAQARIPLGGTMSSGGVRDSSFLH